MNQRIRLYSLIVNILCIIFLLGNAVYLIAVWNSLPDQIPGHYDFAGNVTRYDSRGTLVIVPIINLVIFLLMSLVERFPRLWNTGIRITEENRVRVYGVIKNMLVTTKFSFVIMFVFISVTQTLDSGMPGWFFGVYFWLIFGPIIFYIVKLIKAR